MYVFGEISGEICDLFNNIKTVLAAGQPVELKSAILYSQKTLLDY